jgi:hypothetical protein
LGADEVDCIAGVEAFSVECTSDESCNVSPVSFWFREYSTSAYNSCLHVAFLPAIPTLTRPNSRSTWHEWIRVLFIRFPAWVSGMPHLDLD